MTGFGTCDVPAGGSECIATVNVAFKTAGTIGVNNPVIRSTNKATGASDGITSLYEWDAQAPIVTGLVSHDPYNKILQFNVTENNSGSIWNRVNLKSAYIIATDSKGVNTTINASNIQTNGNTSLGNRFLCTITRWCIFTGCRG